MRRLFAALSLLVALLCPVAQEIASFKASRATGASPFASSCFDHRAAAQKIKLKLEAELDSTSEGGLDATASEVGLSSGFSQAPQALVVLYPAGS
jgi:hypothetical protein